VKGKQQFPHMEVEATKSTGLQNGQTDCVAFLRKSIQSIKNIKWLTPLHKKEQYF